MNMKNYDDLLCRNSHSLHSWQQADNICLTDANTNTLIWTIIEPGLSITTASIATFRPLLGTWKVPGFGGSTINGSLYLHFHNLGTLPAPARGSTSRNAKPWPNTQSGICEDNGSEEFILPPNKILKTVSIALVHNNDDII
jgi:hypothetical protein